MVERAERAFSNDAGEEFSFCRREKPCVSSVPRCHAGVPSALLLQLEDNLPPMAKMKPSSSKKKRKKKREGKRGAAVKRQ